MRIRPVLVILGLVLVAAAGCGDGGGAEATLDEIYGQGLIRYVGEFEPMNDPSPEDGVKHFEFEVPGDLGAGPRGPLCLRGDEYTVDTREGSSAELLIYLQGGGACWETLCSAIELAGSLPVAGILNPESPGNPLAEWDVVYLPYCDGSLFAGDVDRDLPVSLLPGQTGKSGPSYQRGLQNLTAALDIAVREFPNPKRVMLAGVSGGAFGTIIAAPLVRFFYPDVDLLVFNDSGVGVAKDGDPEFVEGLLEGFNADGLIPESCSNCTANGHITRLVEWNLANDPGLSVSALSFTQDTVVATTFLTIPASEFENSVRRETKRIADNYPKRYKRFIINGDLHTTLLNDGTIDAGEFSDILGSLQDEVDGVTVLEWLTAMLDGEKKTWRNLVDPAPN